MPKGGFEPPRVAPYAPQAHVSASSTTSATRVGLRSPRAGCRRAHIIAERKTLTRRLATLTSGTAFFDAQLSYGEREPYS